MKLGDDSVKNKINKLIADSRIIGLLFLLFGFFLFLKPDLANSLIGYFIGGIILISGLFSLFKYFKQKSHNYFFLSYALITIIAGLAIIINPLSISSLITIILGIWMLFNGSTKISTALSLKKYQEEIWPLLLSIGILTLLCGGILIFNPFRGTMILTKTIGIFIIIYAILDIINWLLLRKRSKQIIKFIK